MKNEIIKSLTEIQTVVLDTISTSQRMLTENKKIFGCTRNSKQYYLSYSSSVAPTTATTTRATAAAPTATTAATTATT